RPRPPRPLPYPVTQWLEALTVSSQRALARPRIILLPCEIGWFMFWLYLRKAADQMKATVQADGRVSDRATRYDVEKLKRQDNRPQFILRKDLEILRDLEAVGVPANGGSGVGHSWRPKFLEDGPPDLLPILSRIAATGRGRWEERNGPFLHEGGPRRAEFHWQGEEGGTQELQLTCASTGARLVALPLATPAFVDPTTGAFGRLGSDMDPAHCRS
ncbi:hypothetical protein ACFSHQ_03715, partial [Gemmobacter lanyuensis]